MDLVLFWYYSALLLAVSVIDFEHRRVLNVMVAPAAVLALAWSAMAGTPPLWNALLGGGIGFALFVVISLAKRGALGAGDVKLAGLIGLIVGYPGVITALVIGIMLAGVAAVALIISRRATRKSHMAYAPYLALGAWLTLWSMLGAG